MDVSQDVIVREHDCQTERGIVVELAERAPDGTLIRDPYIRASAYARTLGTDAVDEAGNVIVERGQDLGDPEIDALLAAGIAGQGAFGADVCHQHRRVRDLLRAFHGHRQAGRHR